MVYNLYRYLKAQLTSIIFIANGWEKESPEESITIMQRGGLPDHYNIKQDISIQVLSRSMDVNMALFNINMVYILLKNRFGLILPEAIVGDTVYPEIKTYQVSPIQSPGYLGSDRNSLQMWSFNLMVTTK